jgi:hypothetical protein
MCRVPIPLNKSIAVIYCKSLPVFYGHPDFKNPLYSNNLGSLTKLIFEKRRIYVKDFKFMINVIVFTMYSRSQVKDFAQIRRIF